jgi:hypothetical protein
MLAAEQVLNSLSNFISENIKTYQKGTDGTSRPIYGKLCNEEFNLIVRIRNAAKIYGFNILNDDSFTAQMSSNEKSSKIIQAKPNFCIAKRDICEPVVTFKEAEKKKLEILQRYYENLNSEKNSMSSDHTVSIDSSSPYENLTSVTKRKLRIHLPDDSILESNNLIDKLTG